MLAIFTVLEQKESKQQSLLRKIYLRFLIKKGLIASGFTILLLYNSFPAFFFFRNLFGLSEGVFDQNLLKVVNYLLLIPTTVWLFIVYKTLERLLLRPLWYNICIWIVINIGVPLGFDCYSGGYPFYWTKIIWAYSEEKKMTNRILTTKRQENSKLKKKGKRGRQENKGRKTKSESVPAHFISW